VQLSAVERALEGERAENALLRGQLREAEAEVAFASEAAVAAQARSAAAIEAAQRERSSSRSSGGSPRYGDDGDGGGGGASPLSPSASRAAGEQSPIVVASVECGLDEVRYRCSAGLQYCCRQCQPQLLLMHAAVSATDNAL